MSAFSRVRTRYRHRRTWNRLSARLAPDQEPAGKNVRGKCRGPRHRVGLDNRLGQKAVNRDAMLRRETVGSHDHLTVSEGEGSRSSAGCAHDRKPQPGAVAARRRERKMDGEQLGRVQADEQRGGSPAGWRPVSGTQRWRRLSPGAGAADKAHPPALVPASTLPTAQAATHRRPRLHHR
jgi:hypothetical protein